MKSVWTILFLLNTICFANANLPIEYLTIEERKQIYCTESNLKDPVWCNNFDAGNNQHIVYINGVSPDDSDSLKNIRIEELDNEINLLLNYAICTELKVLILCISESLFIQSDDSMIYGSQRYLKKGLLLNAESFIARYKMRLTN